MKVELDMTKNTAETRAQLVSGYGYIVVYYNVGLQERRMVVAVWNGEQFNYPGSRFTEGHKPTITDERVPRRNSIVGWCQVISWRDDD